MRLYNDSERNRKLLKDAKDLAIASSLNLQLPYKQLDWITSCKIFFPLHRRYWEESKIPKVIKPNNQLQGAYGYALELEKLQLRAPGILLLSYVWDKDTHQSIEKTDNCTFAQKCLQELDDHLLQLAHIGEPISPFIDFSQTPAIHWSRKPDSPGYEQLYPIKLRG